MTSGCGTLKNPADKKSPESSGLFSQNKMEAEGECCAHGCRQHHELQAKILFGLMSPFLPGLECKGIGVFDGFARLTIGNLDKLLRPLIDHRFGVAVPGQPAHADGSKLLSLSI